MTTTEIKKRVAELCAKPYAVEVRALSDEEGGGYIAFLPDLGEAACSATGDTQQKALGNLNEVAPHVFEVMLERQLPIPEPSRASSDEADLQQVPFRVPKSVHRQLKQVARDEGVTLNTLLLTMVTERLTTKGFENRIAAAVEDFVHRIGISAVQEKHTRVRPVSAAVGVGVPGWQRAANVGAVDQLAHAAAITDAYLSKMMGDAPMCDVCGHITVRNGACYKCNNCGNTMHPPAEVSRRSTRSRK